MVTIEYLGKEYDVKSGWDELTIREFVQLQKVVNKAPTKLKEILGLLYQGKQDEVSNMELSTREASKTFPKFYGDMMVACSTISSKDINKAMPSAREEFFKKYLIKFAFGCLIAPVDVPAVDREDFEFDGEVYPLPKSRKVMGKERPMGKISTIQFTEAADLDIAMREYDEGDYSKLANIVSILCTKEGEEYDEDVCLDRAEKFMDLTMDIVWDVFFYLDELWSLSTLHTLQSSLEEGNLNKLLRQSQQD
jgi:hypothetical protein